MSDYNKLTYNELFQINDELRYTIANLKKQLEEYEKCTARVYAPGKSYKELEEKLAILEEEKKTVADRLMASMTQMDKEIKEYKADNHNLKCRNRDLERVIEKQKVIITLAAGYISSCEQFRNEYPTNVQKWLMGGME